MTSQPLWKAILASALCTVAFSQPSLAQAPPATILTVDLENRVEYLYDVADPSQFATQPVVTPDNHGKNFYQGISLSDIVAVNGQPAKGIQIFREQIITLRPNPTPGQAIADFAAGNLNDFTWEFFKPDGTLIGTLESKGITNLATPPYSPPLGVAVNSSVAIVGGSGAFLGARGTHYSTKTIVASRLASISEDPSNRRNTPGGKGQSVIYLIPMERPEIVTASGSPAVFHADFTAVTAAKPGKAGEVLIVKATGLGPTVPGVDPGQPFPTDTTVQINSPVAVTVAGKDAELVNSIGWPGLVNTYRVDFRVPDGTTTGTAAIQLSAAWIAGSAVNIPIQ